MADLFTPSWENPTNSERTELVFQNRNKEYGAYPIRKSYDRTTSRALLIAIGLFVVGVATPFIMRMINNSGAEKVDRSVEVNIELKEPPPLDKNEPPPPPPPPPPPTIETVKFTPPVVVDRQVEEEQPPPQEKLSETNVGVVTQAGDENAVEPPPEVVADPDAGKVYSYVEEMPTFPGGEAALYEYLQRNIKYPPLARENGITGKVFIGFVVDKEGKIGDIKILRSLGAGCDEEALRVIKSMPGWKPGKQNGRTVAVSYSMPINFSLK